MKRLEEKIRSVGSLILAAVLVLSSFGVAHAVAAENVDEIVFIFNMDDAKYTVNGVEKHMKAPPRILHDRIFVPCSALPYDLGFYVESIKCDCIYFRHNGIQIKVHPYDQLVYVNNDHAYWDEHNFKVNPKCFDGVLFMPMLSFARFLGAKDIKVDAGNQVITLTFDQREENRMVDTFYEREVEFTLDSETTFVDGQEYESRKCLTQKDDKLYINVSNLVGVFGYKTEWDGKKLHYYKWNYDGDEKFVNHNGYIRGDFRMYTFGGTAHVLSEKTFMDGDDLFAPLDFVEQIGMDMTYDEETKSMNLKHSVPDDVKINLEKLK